MEVSSQVTAGRAGVLERVRERLLDHPVGRQVDARRQRPSVPLDPQVDRQPGGPGAVGERGDRFQAGRPELLGLATADRLAAQPYVTAYYLAKAGLLGLARSLAQVLPPHGIPVNTVSPAILATARTVGWIAQLNEMIADPEYKIGRPRQLFVGAKRRAVPSIDKR